MFTKSKKKTQITSLESFQFFDNKNIDLIQLQALQNSVPWAKDRSLEKLRKIIEHSQLLITVWSKEKLIGCARVLTDYSARAVIYDAIVHESYRRFGIGTELMNQIVHHPTLSDVEYFFLYTLGQEKFYNNLGWKKCPGTSFFLNNPSFHD